MATEHQIRRDVSGLVAEALLNGKMAVSAVLADAAAKNALSNSRVAFPIISAVETEGQRLIERMKVVYRGALVAKRPSREEVGRMLHDGLAHYLEGARDWGMVQAALPGAASRNALLIRDHEPMAERLRDGLEREMRAVVADLPQKNWWERRPYQLIVGTIGVIVAIAGLLLNAARQ